MINTLLSKKIALCTVAISIMLVCGCGKVQETNKDSDVVDGFANLATSSTSVNAKVVEPSVRPEKTDVRSEKVSVDAQGENTKIQEPAKEIDEKDNITLEQPVSAEKVKEAEQLYEKGFNIYISRNFDEAIKYFDKAISIDPLCYKAITFKGTALCFKGNYKDGMKLIDKALAVKPDFPYSNFNKALAYKLQKNYKEALVWFDKTINYDAKNTWSYFGIACIYAEWGNAPKTVEYLKKAIETDPGVKEVAREEHDLDPVRNDAEFKKLIAQ